MVLLEPGRGLPFEEETFELVLCADTIQEVQDVAQLVADVKRVLAPGGMLALTAPAHGRRTGLRVLRRGFGPVFDPRDPDLRYFTRRSLGDLLDLAGFHSIHIGRDDGHLIATARR
jgi:SAM-dependent methyltransferase